MLARPYLVPEIADPQDLRPLRDAVEVARSREFRDARSAYHQWLRDFVQPLRWGGESLEELRLDPASLRLAEERLEQLVADERRVVKTLTARRAWKRTEWAMTVVGFGLSSATALISPLAGLGVASSVAGFAGWAAGTKSQAPDADRPLNGASMFLAAERQLGFENAIDQLGDRCSSAFTSGSSSFGSRPTGLVSRPTDEESYRGFLSLSACP